MYTVKDFEGGWIVWYKDGWSAGHKFRTKALADTAAAVLNALVAVDTDADVPA